MAPAPPDRPPVAVVIVSFNTCASLRRCLGSLRESHDPSRLTVWVVDNGSEDGSAEMVAAEFPEVHLIPQDENMGFAKAMNLALQHLDGCHICWLNPDAYIEPDTLTELEAVIGRHPDTGLVAPRVLNLDDTEQPSLRRRSFFRISHLLLEATGIDQLWPAVRRLRAQDRYLNEIVVEGAPIDFANGGCLLISCEAARSVGLLDERFWIYSEDMDYCERIRQAGFTLRHAPAAVVHHTGGGSTSRYPGEMRLHLVHAKWQLLGKHFGSWSARGYRWVVFCEAVRRALGAAWRRPDQRSRLRLSRDLVQWALCPVQPLPPGLSRRPGGRS